MQKTPAYAAILNYAVLMNFGARNSNKIKYFSFQIKECVRYVKASGRKPTSLGVLHLLFTKFHRTQPFGWRTLFSENGLSAFFWFKKLVGISETTNFVEQNRSGCIAKTRRMINQTLRCGTNAIRLIGPDWRWLTDAYRRLEGLGNGPHNLPAITGY